MSTTLMSCCHAVVDYRRPCGPCPPASPLLLTNDNVIASNAKLMGVSRSAMRLGGGKNTPGGSTESLSGPRESPSTPGNTAWGESEASLVQDDNYIWGL